MRAPDLVRGSLCSLCQGNHPAPGRASDSEWGHRHLQTVFISLGQMPRQAKKSLSPITVLTVV